MTGQLVQGRACSSPALGYGANGEIIFFFPVRYGCVFYINLIGISVVFIVIH